MINVNDAFLISLWQVHKLIQWDWFGVNIQLFGNLKYDLMQMLWVDVISFRFQEELPFDPPQYPLKPKKEKIIKAPKLKLSKSRFSTGEEHEDRWTGDCSVGEE